MSLISFLSKIFNGIAAFFKQIPAELQNAVHIAVVITEAVKTVLNSPVTDILTAIIPGDIDDKIAEWLRGIIPKLLAELKLVDASVTSTDPQQITTAAIAALQQLDGSIKSAFLHDLTVLIAQEVARAQNNTLSWSDAVYIVEWYYQHKYKQGE